MPLWFLLHWEFDWDVLIRWNIVLVAVAMTKHSKQKQLGGRKASISRLQSVIEGMSGQELKQTPWRNAVDWLVHGLKLNLLSHVAQHICLGMCHPQVGWALTHLLSIKTISQRHGHRPVWRKFFS